LGCPSPCVSPAHGREGDGARHRAGDSRSFGRSGLLIDSDFWFGHWSLVPSHFLAFGELVEPSLGLGHWSFEPSLAYDIRMFVVTLILLMLTLDVVWWRWAHRLAKKLPRRLVWQWAIGLFMGGQLVCFVLM